MALGKMGFVDLRVFVFDADMDRLVENAALEVWRISRRGGDLDDQAEEMLRHRSVERALECFVELPEVRERLAVFCRFPRAVQRRSLVYTGKVIQQERRAAAA